jgi:hypothetical protein
MPIFFGSARTVGAIVVDVFIAARPYTVWGPSARVDGGKLSGASGAS